MDAMENDSRSANEPPDSWKLTRLLAKLSTPQRRLLVRCLAEERKYLEKFPESKWPYGNIALEKHEVPAAVGLERRNPKLAITDRQEARGSSWYGRKRYARGSKRRMHLTAEGRYLANKILERHPSFLELATEHVPRCPNDVLADARTFARAFLELGESEEPDGNWYRCRNMARALLDDLAEIPIDE